MLFVSGVLGLPLPIIAESPLLAFEFVPQLVAGTTVPVVVDVLNATIPDTDIHRAVLAAVDEYPARFEAAARPAVDDIALEFPLTVRVAHLVDDRIEWAVDE